MGTRNRSPVRNARIYRYGTPNGSAWPERQQPAPPKRDGLLVVLVDQTSVQRNQAPPLLPLGTK